MSFRLYAIVISRVVDRTKSVEDLGVAIGNRDEWSARLFELYKFHYFTIVSEKPKRQEKGVYCEPKPQSHC